MQLTQTLNLTGEPQTPSDVERQGVCILPWLLKGHSSFIEQSWPTKMTRQKLSFEAADLSASSLDLGTLESACRVCELVCAGTHRCLSS